MVTLKVHLTKELNLGLVSLTNFSIAKSADGLTLRPAESLLFFKFQSYSFPDTLASFIKVPVLLTKVFILIVLDSPMLRDPIFKIPVFLLYFSSSQFKIIKPSGIKSFNLIPVPILGPLFVIFNVHITTSP